MHTQLKPVSLVVLITTCTHSIFLFINAVCYKGVKEETKSGSIAAQHQSVAAVEMFIWHAMTLTVWRMGVPQWDPGAKPR